MKVRVIIDMDIDADRYANELGREATREYIHDELAAHIIPATRRFYDWEKPDAAHFAFAAVDPSV